MITLGIDIGSITTKAALMRDGSIIATKMGFTGYNSEKAGLTIFREILDESGIGEGSVDAIVSTGYGRNSIKFATKAITEITCHAAGAYMIDKGVRSIIDIGGQDSKALLLDTEGRVKDFAMNDKCAAGTGRFLEVMARAMEMDLDRLGEASLRSGRPAVISSICTVFAESEVISLISRGETRENIIAGIHESVASRITSLARRVNVTEPIMMTGGVAKNIGVVSALEKKLGTKLVISGYAQVNGAIGAAWLAGRL